MHDPKHLDQLLRDLPREQASEDFEQQVLLRLDRDARQGLGGRTRAPWLAVAAVLLTVVGGVIVYLLAERAERRGLERELAALRLEHQVLEQELLQLRERRAQALPRVYLGGSPEADVIFDLEAFVKRRQASAAEMQPASLQAQTQPVGMDL